MANSSYYTDSLSSDDSFEWSSDSVPKTKRKITRKTKTIKKKPTSAAGSTIKKPKKPGRKPMVESSDELPTDPKLKRKAQNRAAQRAFRERKEQFVNELQAQIRELKAAKEKREKELSRENARLKKENERLKEENYILKDAKFTFEFPHKTLGNDVKKEMFKTEEELQVTTNTMNIQPVIHDEQVNIISQEDISELSSSPLSEATTTFSVSDTCANNNNCCCHFSESLSSAMFDSESSNTDCLTSNAVTTTTTTTTAAAAAAAAATVATTSTIPNFTFASQTPTSDLFHGKDNNLFLTDYQLPLLNTAPIAMDNSFSMINDSSFSALFGTDGLLDTTNNNSLEPFHTTADLDPLFSEQMQALFEQHRNSNDPFLKCAPENEKPCKKKVIHVLKNAKGANRRVYQVNQDVKSYCPNIDLDQLCDDLKKKISFDSNHILTDEDVDLYIECIQRRV